MSEATCQRARECRDERFDRNLFIIFLYVEKQHNTTQGRIGDVRRSFIGDARSGARRAMDKEKKRKEKMLAVGWVGGLLHLVLGPGARGTCRCVWIDVRTDEDFFFFF